MQTHRPQTLLMTLLAVHLLDTDTAVSVGSVLAALCPLGIEQSAVRSSVARMTSRGLLARHPRGRTVSVSLTARASAVLTDGRRRMWELGPVDRDWDGSWTVVGYSLPESARSERHDLRSRLTWAGFGLLQSGLWIAPGSVEVGEVVADLAAGDGTGTGLTVLAASALAPTTPAELIARAFDVDALAAGYAGFLDRWDRPRAQQPLADLDPFRRQLLLHTDWLALIRHDPRLPMQHLPRDWPGIRAERLVRRLDGLLDLRARRIAADILERVAV